MEETKDSLQSADSKHQRDDLKKSKKKSQKIQKTKHIDRPINEIYHSEKNVQSVTPYIYTFSAFAKGRWLNRTLIDVVESEFGGVGYDHEFWVHSITIGSIRINHCIVSPAYIIQNSDYLTRKTHRHEPSITGNVEIIAETATMVAVVKPASLPMHPCGAYYYNTLSMMLQLQTPMKCAIHRSTDAVTSGATVEDGVPIPHTGVSFNRFDASHTDCRALHQVHRLDRVTSGLVVLAKTSKIARNLSEQIQNRDTKKTYLARVRGRFPSNLSHLKELNKNDLMKAVEDYRSSGDVNRKNVGDCNSDTILDYMTEALIIENNHTMEHNNYKKVKEIESESDQEDRQKFKKLKINSSADAIDVYRNGSDSSVNSALHQQQLQQKQKHLLKLKQNETPNSTTNTGNRNDCIRIPVGYAKLPCSRKQLGKYYDIVVEQRQHSKDTDPYQDVTQELESILIQCPLITVNHREGIHACQPDPQYDESGHPVDPTLKYACSLMTSLGYDEATDTSLILCHPITGRTHQLRLHCSLVMNPIANDVCYGGELFYQEPMDKKRAAVAAYKRYVSQHGSMDISIPHLHTLIQSMVHPVSSSNASSPSKSDTLGSVVENNAACITSDDKGTDSIPSNNTRNIKNGQTTIRAECACGCSRNVLGSMDPLKIHSTLSPNVHPPHVHDKATCDCGCISLLRANTDVTFNKDLDTVHKKSAIHINTLNNTMSPLETNSNMSNCPAEQNFNTQLSNGFLKYVHGNRYRSNANVNAILKPPTSSSSCNDHVVAADEDSTSTELSEDDLIIQDCGYCKEADMLTLHQLMHCDSIYLHALAYECNSNVEMDLNRDKGADGCDNFNSSCSSWSFQTPWPDWALPFMRPCYVENC